MTIKTPEHATHFVDVIRYWATQRPEQEVLRFYPQGEGHYQTLTFLQLHQRCEAIASHLHAYQGQRALLLFNSSLEFLQALFACFYAGVIAVPAYPPKKNYHINRLSALIADCQPNVILSASNISDNAKPLFIEAADNSLHNLTWLDCDMIDSADQYHYHTYHPTAPQLAFLQYTSGSTAKPKGVMISHANLMANIRMAKHAFGLPENARCVSWLPLFHDMGLIGSVLAPLYWGAGSVIMPPAAFLQKPLRWLKLLDEFGRLSPVGCTAPNFSYQLCVDSISDAEAEQLNLANWVFALTGAEPIRATTLNAFIKKFSKAQFQASAFVPAYGMAECTVLATCRQHKAIQTRHVSTLTLAQNRIDVTANGNITLTSSGSTCEPQILRIVDTETLNILDDGNVGEIWLKGEHIAQGYWHNAELTQATFQAYTRDGQGPFLRTGDLGAIMDGELFVTGRQKDLLIIRGRNYYPQDIELTAMHASDGLQKEHCAAFTIDDNNEEKLVIVQEVERQAMRHFDATQAAQKIRLAIAREHGIDTFAIAFIRFASIAKTSSGKIQRHACKQAFLTQQLTTLASWQQQKQPIAPQLAQPDCALRDISQQALEQWIVQWLSQKARIEASAIAVDAALDGLGLDSIDLIQLSATLEAWLGAPLDHTLVYEKPSIRALAVAIKAIANAENPPIVRHQEIEGVI